MQTETTLVLKDGMYAGLIGYAAVVVVYAVINVLSGLSPFYTPALFGSALFYGLHDPATLVISPGPVLAYNMVHVLAFVVLGLVASWLVAKAEQHPVARFGVLFVLVFIAAHVYAALYLFARHLLVRGAAWQIGISSLAAAALMGWYLLCRRPLLRLTLRSTPIGEEEQ
jgi:hypothetical protein